jgi:outer membrane biosynthesis protein TonB
MDSPLNKNSLKWSLIFHGFLLLVVIGFAVRHRFIKKKLPEPVEFTVVLPQDMPEPVKEKAPSVEPVQERDPVMPENLPPIKEAVVLKKKPPEKKPPEKKPTPPKEEKPPEKKPPEKKPFEKGKRVVKTPEPRQPDFTKLKRATTAPVDKPLSRKEIADALKAGARSGARNSLPDSEVSRCISIVQRAMYDSWEQPGSAEAGPRPTQLEIRLDKSGRLVSYTIRQSSGSRYCDQSVLKAAASVRQIRGLSADFLKQYEILIIDFRIE